MIYRKTCESPGIWNAMERGREGGGGGVEEEEEEEKEEEPSSLTFLIWSNGGWH